jgi:serine/threonine-protein kinase
MGEPGLIAGKYELVGPVGQGGMASVWQGLVHGAAGFTKLVAIKRVRSEMAEDPNFTAMFVEEARVVSSLQHPNIVQVFDFDRDESGAYFIVMEWIDGLDMEGWVRAHTMGASRVPWHLVTGIVVEVLRAVSAAHERLDENGRPAPVIHRDINPANILIGVSGHVKLADFGLARATDRAAMTKPGIVKGKLSYLSPEILQGAPASPSSDVYGVGIVLWEALTGKRLFWHKNPGEIVLRLSKGVIPPLEQERSDLPRALIEVVNTALALKPEDRFDSADEMLRTLTAILRTHPEPTDAKPIAWSVKLAQARLREYNPDPQ